MAQIRPRNDPVRLLWQRIFLMVLFIAVFIAAGGVWKIYGKDQESLQQRREAEAQLKELTNRKDRLTANIHALDSDRGKEEALRSQYEIGKDGEGLIVIVDEKPATSTTATTTKKWYEKVFPWW